MFVISSCPRWTVDTHTLLSLCLQSCPGIGDDTPHVPIGPFFHVPTYVSSNPPSGTDDTRIDLVFVDFIQEDVIEGLNAIQSERVFVLGDVRGYTTVLLRDVWGVYAGFAWV